MSKKTSTPTSTVEDYLKCILVHQRDEDDLVGMGRIAGHLDVAPGTVTSMMKTLSESGLVAYEPYSGVRLTEAGHKLAVHVLRRHRLLELFLVQVVGLDWSEVHAEAELLEHAVSDRLIERIDELLEFPTVDPHGDPIPTRAGVVEQVVEESLLGCEVGECCVISRVVDQSSEFLQSMERLGLVPGTRLTVRSRDDVTDAVELLLAVEGDVEPPPARTLGSNAAAKIFVREGA